MRLFLSSQDLGNYGETARKMAGVNPKVAYIKNAQDDKPSQERNFTTTEKKKMFESFGFEFEEIDLRDFFDKKEELLKKIITFGSVFCAGGNTFILRRAMKCSGLDEILKDLLSEDRVLYGGWSAGACITANSLDGIQYGDRPQPGVVPKEYPIKNTIWKGLDFVNFMTIPHCNMDWFIDDANKAEKYMKKKGISYKKINDGQVYIVDGKKQELLA